MSSDRTIADRMCRLSDRHELMIGHRASHRPSMHDSVGVGNPIAACTSASNERIERRTDAHRSHPRKLPRPPLIRGFGRHTSKVIAYLRDQVGPPPRRATPRQSLNSSLPYRRGGDEVSHGKKGNAGPAFREVIKTVVLAEPLPVNYR